MWYYLFNINGILRGFLVFSGMLGYDSRDGVPVLQARKGEISII